MGPTKKQSRRGQRKTTPSPPNAEFCQFKTPQKQYQSYPKSYFYSEPPRIVKNHRRSVTPKNLSTSPLNFAGPKCLEPPTPCSLPKPPTTWTRPEDMPNARQTLSFEDLVKLDETNPQDLSQQLKMMNEQKTDSCTTKAKIQLYCLEKKTKITTKLPPKIPSCSSIFEKN